MGRHDEVFQDNFEHAIEIGKENAVYIDKMRRWCKHFRVEVRSSGLYAQMAQLPIGMHEISCPYTDHHTGSAILRRVCSAFLVSACDGCPHHEPNGDDSWGRQIIDEHKEQVRLRAEADQKRTEEIERLRSELRAQSKSIGEGSPTESQRIAEFLESMFSDSSEEQEASAAKLKQAAQVGADLFPEPAIDLLTKMFHNDEFGRAAIEICTELAERLPGNAKKFERAALDAIRNRRYPHEASAIIARIGDAATYPIDVECVKCLLFSQYHDVPIGGWGYKPDYSATTEVLVRSYDADDHNFLKLLREYLQYNNDEVRKHFCGALNLLQKTRPAIVHRLLPDLMKSLERYEKKDITHGGPSGKIIKVFQWAFHNASEMIDSFLAENMERVRPTVQEDIVHVYRDQFFDRNLDWRERRGRDESNISHPERVAIRRLLTWIKNDALEPEIRNKAAEVLDIACSHATGVMVKEFDYLLGYYALLCEQQEPPPAPPKILLPNQQEEDPALVRMNEVSRKQQWGFLKHNVVKCLEELCKLRPREVFDSVYGCLSNPSAQLGAVFRGTVVSLLGELGSTFGLQARALPILMRELMNYGSAWVRAKAIDAATEMFYSPPPANVVDTIIVHLQDPKVVVHQAAVRAVDRRSGWFDASQSLEAVNCLAALAHAYRTDPYELEHICEAAIAMANRHAALKKYALAIVESVFPTKQEYVDKKIVEELLHMTNPNDKIAARVAIHAATHLAMFDRDRYNGDDDRDGMAEWMHELPTSTVVSVADKLLELAVQLASRDFWESWQFASLFAKNGLLTHEQKTLAAIHASYPSEPKFDDIRRKVTGLINLSASNQCLQVGNEQNAKECLRQAAEGLK
jgi:hypothetical protein